MAASRNCIVKHLEHFHEAATRYLMSSRLTLTMDGRDRTPYLSHICDIVLCLQVFPGEITRGTSPLGHAGLPQQRHEPHPRHAAGVPLSPPCPPSMFCSRFRIRVVLVSYTTPSCVLGRSRGLTSGCWTERMLSSESELPPHHSSCLHEMREVNAFPERGVGTQGA